MDFWNIDILGSQNISDNGISADVYITKNANNS